MKYRLLAFLLAAGVPVTSHSQDQLVLRSSDLKTIIEKRNERIRAKELEAEAAQARTGHLARSFFPNLEVHAAQDTFKKGQQPGKTQPAYGVEANVNLFNGGRDALESSKRNIAAERTKLERSVVLADELQNARRVYWSIIYFKELGAALTEAIKTNESNLGAASRRIRSGVATETDRVEFEMKAVDLRRAQLTVNQELATRRRELLVILGYPPETAAEFPEELGHDHQWENLLAHSENEHFDLTRPAEMRSEELAAQARIESRSWLPKIDAYAGWNQFNELEEDFTAAKDRQESVLGIRASLSLGAAISSRTEAAAVRGQALAAKAQARYLKREVENHIHSEMNELKFLHSLVHEADENIKRAGRYYQLTQSEYGRGVKNSPDVLGAADKVFEARKRKLEILRDFQIAKTHVLSKIGK